MFTITQLQFSLTLSILLGSSGLIDLSSSNILPYKITASPQAAQNKVREVFQPAEVRPLPGGLDTVPLVQSNSPEWVKTEGILLSTFPSLGKTNPAAHLNFPLQGPFNLFAHHFVHTPKDLKTLYLGILVHNPGRQPITIDILQAASYLLEPEAPFQSKPPLLDNPTGLVFSGPGIRAVDTVLRGQRQAGFPARLKVPPGQSQLLLNHPIPVQGLARPVNGRSTFMRLRSNGKVYVASLAMFARKNAKGSDRAPTLQEWQQLLETGSLAGPRDKKPTPPEQTTGVLVYGRVAGVQQGATWKAQLTDPQRDYLAIPTAEKAIAYALSTLPGGRLGTGQVQAAPLLARYADTAYRSHGNYTVHYDLTIPFKNTSSQTQTVTLSLVTPLKEDQISKVGLRFREPPLDFPYFRGTIRLRYQDRMTQKAITRYLHLWQRVGQQVEPLAEFKLNPDQQQRVQLDFLYPPDSTPPQVLMIRTLVRQMQEK